MSTVLTFSAPTNVQFMINPNAEEGQNIFVPEYRIENKSNAPIEISFKSFEVTAEGVSIVLPDTYPDWSNLGLADSKNLAIGVKPSGSGWLTQRVNPVWAESGKEFSETIGTIAGNSSADIAFDVVHGYAFENYNGLICDMILIIKIID